MPKFTKHDRSDFAKQMAGRINEYIDQCDYDALIELYKLCYGEDDLVTQLRESLEE